MFLESTIRCVLQRIGYDVVRRPSEAGRTTDMDIPPEMSDFDRETISLALPFTMTSPQRVCALVNAVRYVSRHRIPGDIVECGVWKGGSMMAVARTLIAAGDSRRRLYLYDTFDGMPPPTDCDVDHRGTRAQ